MPFTAVSIQDTLVSPTGVGVAFGVVVAYPKMGFANGGVTADAVSAVADANGAFTMSLSATDDPGTDITDPSFPAGQQPSYHLLAFVPISGENLYDRDVFVPSVATPTILANLPVTS